MGSTRALIGLAVALLCPAAALAQAPGADAQQQDSTGAVTKVVEGSPTDSTSTPARVDLFLPRNSPVATATLADPQISPASYDAVTSAYVPPQSTQAYPPDVADRVVTVWVSKSR